VKIEFISVSGGVLTSDDVGRLWQNKRKGFNQSGKMCLVNATLLLASWQYVYSSKLYDKGILKIIRINIQKFWRSYCFGVVNLK
jgi:hypothetical protein